MRTVFALFLAALCALPGVTDAGAWLRAEGAGFLSWSVKFQDGADSDGYASLFAEYGINPDLTVGLDLGTNEDGDHMALAFVLMPLARGGTWHGAFQLAAGALEQEPAMRPGLSVGRALKLGGRSGWVNFDMMAPITPGDTALATEATLGIDLAPRSRVIWQVHQGGAPYDPSYLRLTGALVQKMAPGLHLELGMTGGLKNAEDFGLKLGVWRIF